jgi:hypothetical protein
MLAVPYRNRVVWANFGSNYPNTLVFSDNFTAGTVGNDVLAANGRNVSIVAGNDGDEIVGLAPVMLTAVGTPVESALLVLRRYSSFLVTGEPDQTTGGTNSLAVNAMSVAAGCASPWTIQSTPYGIFWAGQNEVWCFKQGQIPIPIGTKIQPALLRTPRSLSYKLSASYFNGFYRLAVFGEDVGALDYSSGCKDQYWLDLRNGAPPDAASAQWWGPQQYAYQGGSGATRSSTGVMFRDDRPGGSYSLYGFERSDNQGGSLNSAIVRYDSDNVVDVSNASPNVDYSADLTIKPDLITKEYDLGDPMLQKIYDGMEANVWASQTGRLLAQGVLDGGAQYAETNIDVVATGFGGDSAPIPTTGASMPRSPQAIAAFDTNRKTGTTIQLRVQGQTGYLIDSTNDQIAFEQGPDAADADGQTVEIARGFYSTLTDLLAEIGSKMRASSCNQGSNGLVGIDGEVLTDNNYCTVLCFEDTGQTSVSQAVKDKTSALFSLLGFSTGANLTNDSLDPLIPWHLTGDMAVWAYNAPIWEINGLGMRLEVIPRRPT